MGRNISDTDLRDVRGRSLSYRLNSGTDSQQPQADENDEESKPERFHQHFITLFPSVVNEERLRCGAVAAQERKTDEMRNSEWDPRWVRQSVWFGSFFRSDRVFLG